MMLVVVRKEGTGSVLYLRGGGGVKGTPPSSSYAEPNQQRSGMVHIYCTFFTAMAMGKLGNNYAPI